MININGTEISFDYMGLFTTDDTWIHPKACEKTVEIIYVTEGTVHLKEEENIYDLEKGDLILLRPHVTHEGCKASHGKTAFYWLHFTISREAFPNRQSAIIKNFTYPSLFKELLHFCHMPNCEDYVKDSILAHLLSAVSQCTRESSASALARSVFEWTRINTSRGLTVSRIAEHFGYNSEYISRVIKKHYGLSLKCLIDDFLIKKAKEYLSNTNYSVKEISALLGFSSANTFINFYKYHEKVSPQKYRNTFSFTHMNKK